MKEEACTIQKFETEQSPFIMKLKGGGSVATPDYLPIAIHLNLEPLLHFPALTWESQS